MICKSCKRDIDDDSIFCKYCGEKQIRERKKKTEIKVPAPKQLPSGTWFGRITVDGERVSVSAPTEKEYYAKARAVKAGLIEIAKAPKKLTLRQVVRKYIDSNAEVLSPSTIRGYEKDYRNRFKAYMDKDIHLIDYQVMINEEAKLVSPKTVENGWGLVSAALRAIGETPPSINKPAVPEYDGDWLDYEQIQIFLDAVRGDSVEIAALLALHSLRLSELLDLEVSSFSDQFITVKGATVLNRENKLVHKETNKNRSSARTVPIVIPRILELLPEDGKVVTIAPPTIIRRLKMICNSAGLPPCSCHDLRRSFASLAYHLRWSEQTTMQVGGWSDMHTVRKIYQKLAAKDKNADIERMIEFYENGNKNGNEK